jgi:hypothetical protein
MLEEIAPGGVNKEIAQKSLNSLSDKDFELLMKEKIVPFCIKNNLPVATDQLFTRPQ